MKFGFEEILKNQRNFFRSGVTRDVRFRIENLSKLEKALKNSEQKIIDALKADLGKPELESFSSEIAFLYKEISALKRECKVWSQTKTVKTPWLTMPGKSKVYVDPLGVVLIIAPWNYPLQLSLAPLIGAVAAGNCAIVKPSELAPKTSQVLADIISSNFSNEYIHVVQGGKEETAALLELRFDHIFFTGGEVVGRIVMTAAAKHLTPVTLELGGKSPCIIDESCEVDLSARRVVWGKFFNAGQTCIAPDYLLVQRSIHDEFVDRVKFYIQKFYGENPQKSESYSRIVNLNHFNRLVGLIQGSKLIHGGRADEKDLYIEPTVLAPPSWTAKVMSEEIFGPLLPVLSFDNLDEAIEAIAERPHPLALYMFSTNPSNIDKVISRTHFGGGCVNDVLLHISNPYLPFGGVGSSGMGSYHGEYSMRTFSHLKGVIFKSKYLDLELRYPPYDDGKISRIRKLMTL